MAILIFLICCYICKKTIYDKHVYNKEGFNREGYDKKGFNKDRISKETGRLYNKAGYNKAGYDKTGFNKNNISIETGTLYNKEGYNKEGYDKTGFNKNNISIETGTLYNKEGYDKTGFNKNSISIETGTIYNKAGYDKDGYDNYGYNSFGYSKFGYDIDGFDKFGYDMAGYDKNYYDKNGYDTYGYDKSGYDRKGCHRKKYDIEYCDEVSKDLFIIPSINLPKTNKNDNMFSKKGFSYNYIVDYFPKRFSVDMEDNSNRYLVYDFKDGKQNHKFISMLSKFILENYSFSSDTILLPIPASKKDKNHNRYYNLLNGISREIGIKDGFDCISVEFDREAKHLSTDFNKQGKNYKIDHSRVKGKHIILLDDIITTGSGFVDLGNELLALGAKDVVGLFLGETKSQINWNTKYGSGIDQI
ncbi:MAG: hypothetical protein ACRCTS_01130 [Fusobacteriaceae bacterium]